MVWDGADAWQQIACPNAGFIAMLWFQLPTYSIDLFLTFSH